MKIGESDGWLRQRRGWGGGDGSGGVGGGGSSSQLLHESGAKLQSFQHSTIILVVGSRVNTF